MRRKPGQFFFLATQGCKVNQYESQAIREAWIIKGLIEVPDPAQADLILINSCAVTERAVLDLAKLARGFAAHSPRPWIVVAGCAVEADRERVLALPGVDEVVAQHAKASLADSSRPHELFAALHISDYNRARAVLKVQDGCSHGCTYCIIPSTRGASVSREPDDVIAEARRLLGAGIREISLCGINLRQYGRELSPAGDFWDLLARVDRALSPDWKGRARLRLGSLEPADLNAKALETLAACDMMCPHLHLSLQSGSSETLRRMGRGHYGPERVADFLERLAGIWKFFGLGADLIAGFPGETEDHFRQTLDVVEGLPLTYAHVFPYSERPGTPAATFPDSVPGHLRRERAKILRQTASRKHLRFLHRLLTEPTMDVVVEENGTGLSQFYVECVLGKTGHVRGRKLVRVRPVDIDGDRLLVRLAGESS